MWEEPEPFRNVPACLGSGAEECGAGSPPHLEGRGDNELDVSWGLAWELG